MLAVADLAGATLALVTGVIVVGDDALLWPTLGAVLAVVVVGKLGGLYDRDESLLNKTTLDEAPKLFVVATLYALLLSLAESIFVAGHLGKDQVLGLWALLFLAMLAGRFVARAAARAVTEPERCLVVGDGVASDWLERKFASYTDLRATIVGRVPFEQKNEDDRLLHVVGGEEVARAPVLGTVVELDTVLRAHEVERAIIAPGEHDSESMLSVIRLVKAMGLQVSVLPRVFEVVGSSVEFDDIHGTTMLGLRRERLTRSSRAIKRLTDIAGALAIASLTAPVWAAIAVAVRLDSEGPILFRQRRVGRDAREFTMLKFRTMFDGADELKAELEDRNEADGLFKIADDPRVTRVGRLLRRSSLDELPQLVNVLRGEMSLVGPRPLVPDDDCQVEGWDRRRLHLYPGMTGLWQIFGSSRIPLDEMVKIDYLYGTNWSLWLDVKILLRTVSYVVARRGL